MQLAKKETSKERTLQKQKPSTPSDITLKSPNSNRTENMKSDQSESLKSILKGNSKFIVEH